MLQIFAKKNASDERKLFRYQILAPGTRLHLKSTILLQIMKSVNCALILRKLLNKTK